MVGNVRTEEHVSRLKGAAAPQLHSVAVKNQGFKLSILHIFHENPGIFCYCLNVKHSILKSGATNFFFLSADQTKPIMEMAFELPDFKPWMEGKSEIGKAIYFEL